MKKPTGIGMIVEKPANCGGNLPPTPYLKTTTKPPKERASFGLLNLLVRLRCFIGLHKWYTSGLIKGHHRRFCGDCNRLEILRECGVIGEYWFKIK